ncbi:MAG: DUF3786 domain-containing protein, partial [Actinomycetota bacterium]
KEGDEVNKEMGIEHSPQEMREAREVAVRKLRLLDPSWMASRSGTFYSYPGRVFVVPFFGERYTVSYPEGEVNRENGTAAGAREALIILHYLVQADGTQVRDQWVAYRDLPGARYHEPAFVAEVEGPLSRGLAGRLEALRKWAETTAREVELPGDVAAAWDVLPRVPLLLVFNEADEEFPASARVFFDASAPNYLPTEDLSVLAELAALRILESVGALEGRRER